MGRFTPYNRDGIKPASQTVYTLWWVNIGLQVCDGVITYHGVHNGFQEGNPLIQMLIGYWGIEWALVSAKTGACGLFVFLRIVGLHRIRARALVFIAVCYVAFSIGPWAALLLG